MTTRRYTQEDIVNFHNAPDYIVISCQVTDIYGDNGITGVCIVKLEDRDGSAYIDTFLLSCRVMGRNVEYAFLNRIVGLLREKGIKTINARYIRTSKNKANMDFYTKAGFSIVSSADNIIDYCLANSVQSVNTDQIKTILKGDI
jgi:Predicted enzyme involved in methoxymalonyl-ACP biosynthesis